ncbi:MAG: hypothetical protein H7Y38_11960 [Armatimonadetes bacterium]|nr:hypothetical protein [Armatimonadota bacterium]
MTVLGSRPHYSGKVSAVSGGIYVALLTALLLLSPHTARAVAQVLTQNGVALPAHVVRVLDALPVEPVRDALRREEESVREAVAETVTPTEPAPETGAVRATSTVPVHAPLTACPSAPRSALRQAVVRPALPGRFSPRAPPV